MDQCWHLNNSISGTQVFDFGFVTEPIAGRFRENGPQLLCRVSLTACNLTPPYVQCMSPSHDTSSVSGPNSKLQALIKCSPKIHMPSAYPRNGHRHNVKKIGIYYHLPSIISHHGYPSNFKQSRCRVCLQCHHLQNALHLILYNFPRQTV